MSTMNQTHQPDTGHKVTRPGDVRGRPTPDAGRAPGLGAIIARKQFIAEGLRRVPADPTNGHAVGISVVSPPSAERMSGKGARSRPTKRAKNHTIPPMRAESYDTAAGYEPSPGGTAAGGEPPVRPLRITVVDPCLLRFEGALNAANGRNTLGCGAGVGCRDGGL